MTKQATNLIGKRYGRLTVTHRGPNTSKGRNRVQWYCKCDCGNEHLVSRSNLTSGNVKSCGCLNKLPKGEANFNILYRNYKNNAEKRNYTFNLNKDSFKMLTKKECYYCGLEPNMIQNNSESNNGEYIYNGIDRLDNSIGYELGNCVTACKECNLAKGTKTKEEFLNWIKRVYENNESIS